MINAGKMLERVVLQVPSEARNQYGETTIEWTVAATVWASVEGVSSREMLQAMQANVIVSHKIRIRFYEGLTADYRIVWRERNLEIASVLEQQNRTLHEIFAKEVT